MNDSINSCLTSDKFGISKKGETQESETVKSKLHNYLVRCMKNPGHVQFIPIDAFTLKHLPEVYRDNDLYEYIKVVAKLTVSVCVTNASPYRPEFWPNTTQPYPFYNMSEKKHFIIGSGSVRYVNKFQDGVKQYGGVGHTTYTKCWCRMCEDSDSPSNIWWEFYVYTATHLVFDAIEANHTTLRLFYERDDSPVFSIDKVCVEDVEDVNIVDNTSRLKCVTCDNNLGDTLNKMWKHFKDVCEIISFKTSDDRNKITLNFIVSHPHGCSQQVSVGRWKDILNVDDRKKFTYTTCTCPGSSGAHVQCVGYTERRIDIIHSGSLNPELNYSGGS